MKMRILLFIVSCLFVIPCIATTWIKGIYVTQHTAANKRLLQNLITQARTAGINTFVVDLQHHSRLYRNNIGLLHKNHLRYVARIVIFPDGGTDAQVLNPDYWRKKYQLVQEAIKLGAQEIQLDYIRYKTSQPASDQNADNIYRVIKWFKQQLKPQNIPLQIDVFGVASFDEALHIGHDLPLFAASIDAMCPMVYPSHYEPYRKHARDPYRIVYSSLQALQKQFKGRPPFRIYPFIELYNYRYPLSRQTKLRYIYAQIRAVEDADVDGWFAWSPTNKYGKLFEVLRSYDLRY